MKTYRKRDFMYDNYYKLVNRTRISTTVDNKIIKAFNELADETRLNKSKLYDEALTDLLIKYGKQPPK